MNTVTKQEFIQLNAEAVKKSTRRSLIVVGIGWAVTIALCVIGLPCLKKLQESDWLEHPELWKRYWFEAVFGILIFLFIVAASKVKQVFGVLCPNCGWLLFGISSRLTIMTGNCAHCGERVLNESK